MSVYQVILDQCFPHVTVTTYRAVTNVIIYLILYLAVDSGIPRAGVSLLMWIRIYLFPFPPCIIKLVIVIW